MKVLLILSSFKFLKISITIAKYLIFISIDLILIPIFIHINELILLLHFILIR